MLRILLPLLLLSACAARSPTPLPSAAQAPREETLTLSTLLREPQRWSGQRVTLIAPVLLSASDRILTLWPVQAGQTDQSALWLAEAPPDTVRRQLDGGAGYLKLRGRLSPPGAFGRDQQYTYQFVADEIGILEPERTTIANLADNPRAIDGVVLTLHGTLLLRGSSALLVDRVSTGGVPQADARQIKLPRAAIDAALLSAFRRSGNVSWGPVRVVGWWQNAGLTPFRIEPAD